MGQRATTDDAGRVVGWIMTSLGFLFLLFAGFGVGLVVGFVMEEPTLVAGHIAGRTAVIDWGPERVLELDSESVSHGTNRGTLAPVGAGPPSAFDQISSGPGVFSIQVGPLETNSWRQPSLSA